MVFLKLYDTSLYYHYCTMSQLPYRGTPWKKYHGRNTFALGHFHYMEICDVGQI